MNREEAIVQSWTANAANWINTINSGALESRILVANQAMVDAITDYKPTSLLNVG